MSRRSKLCLVLAAVAALMVIPATSSAAVFKWSATGTFSSKPLETQVLTLDESWGKYGALKCNSAGGSGNLVSTDFSEFELEVTYSNCVAFGFQGWQVSPARYRYHADGTLDIVKPFTISSASWGCSVKIHSQNNLSSVQYTNVPNKVQFDNTVGGITYTTEGKNAGIICPNKGTGATLDGLNELERVGGGSVQWWP